jgi:predicted nucleotidyltransferase
MIPYSKIENAAKILAEAARPEKIMLFGSYARGEAREDLD